jgi:hypothetical protein
VAAAAAFIGVWMSDGTAGSMPITVLDRTFDLSGVELFLTGAVTAAVFAVGLLLISSGTRRATGRRRKLRHERRAERERLARLEAEKRDLERRLATTGTTPAAAAGPEPAADRDESSPTTPAPATQPMVRPSGVVDRDDDGVDDRDETRAPTGRHVSVPDQQSGDQLVAGGPHADHRARRD